MTDAWNMQSNIKAKPGSQGTLFQPTKSVLNPAQRWPRGYTPERQAEVSHALKDTPVWADPEGVGIEEEDHAGRARVESQARPRVVQAIARSTVPVEHLQGLTEIHDNVAENTSGTYWPSSRSLAVDMSGHHAGSREAERVMIHELGHHVHNDGTTEHGSYEAMKTVNSVAEKHAWQDKGKYQERPNRSGQLLAVNKVQAGVHEALADNYVTEHYRTPGRNPQPVAQGEYERNFTPPDRDRRYPGYNDVRPPQPTPLMQQRQFENGQHALIPVNTVLRDQERAAERKQRAQRDATSWAVGHTG